MADGYTWNNYVSLPLSVFRGITIHTHPLRPATSLVAQPFKEALQGIVNALKGGKVLFKSYW